MFFWCERFLLAFFVQQEETLHFFGRKLCVDFFQQQRFLCWESDGFSAGVEREDAGHKLLKITSTKLLSLMKQLPDGRWGGRLCYHAFKFCHKNRHYPSLPHRPYYLLQH